MGIFLKVLVFFLIIIVLYFSFVFFFPLLTENIRSKSAPSKITSARNAEEQILDEDLKKQISVLTNIGVIEEKISSSIVDVCYITHGDQGWFVKNWYQDCYLRYVEGFSTSLSQEEVASKINLSAEAHELFGELPARIADIPNKLEKNCSIYSKEFRDRLFVFSSQDPCLPDKIKDFNSGNGPLGKELTYSYLKNEEGDQVSNTQVWITFDKIYYHESLGCVTKFFFCTSPRQKPITAI